MGLGKFLVIRDGSLLADNFHGFLGGKPLTLHIFMPSKPLVIMNSSHVLLTLTR